MLNFAFATSWVFWLQKVSHLDPRTAKTQHRKFEQMFPGQELRGYSPNSYIHVSVSDLYIPLIGLPVLLQENRWADRYTDKWMRNSFSGKHKFKFLCNATVKYQIYQQFITVQCKDSTRFFVVVLTDFRLTFFFEDVEICNHPPASVYCTNKWKKCKMS